MSGSLAEPGPTEQGVAPRGYVSGNVGDLRVQIMAASTFAPRSQRVRQPRL